MRSISTAVARAAATSAVVSLLLAACSGEPPIPLIDAGDGAGGAATSSTSSSTGGGAGGVDPGVCGNGVAELGEQCDGADLFGNTCGTVGKGFGAGELGCTKKCLFDTSDCKLIEGSCVDGEDNDQNGLADCDDPQCAAACGDPCAAGAIYALPDQSSVLGSNGGHAATLTSSCAAPAGAGPGIVFGVTASTTGVLEAVVTSAADLAVSIRTTCGDAAAEIACVNRFIGLGTIQRVEVPSTVGDVFFVVVQGHAAADTGTFTLSVSTRPIACGDGFRDGAEACDDGNEADGDGCSAACALEPTEVEPNEDAALANAYASPWVGEIAPAGDADVVAIEVPSVPASVHATVLDFDGYACNEGGLEGRLEILAPDGTTVLASDDAGATGTCPSAMTGVAAPGTYYVRLAASALALTPTFPYRLDVVVR